MLTLFALVCFLVEEGAWTFEGFLTRVSILSSISHPVLETVVCGPLLVSPISHSRASTQHTHTHRVMLTPFVLTFFFFWLYSLLFSPSPLSESLDPLLLPRWVWRGQSCCLVWHARWVVPAWMMGRWVVQARERVCVRGFPNVFVVPSFEFCSLSQRGAGRLYVFFAFPCLRCAYV